MRTLVHACCGPCAVYPWDALAAEGIEATLYFFNPNIQPAREHQRRLEALRLLAEKKAAPLIARADYDLEGWMRQTAFREEQRCLICYRRRLSSAAQVAKHGRYDAFTTSLLYSRRQKHELIRELAEAVAEEVGVPFLYRDFRVGWEAGIEESKRLGLYRQEYCGCLFSERDRFMPRPRGSDRAGGPP